jgi:hypothetical protein
LSKITITESFEREAQKRRKCLTSDKKNYIIVK